MVRINQKIFKTYGANYYEFTVEAKTVGNQIVAEPVVTIPSLSGVRRIHAAVAKRFALFAGVVADQANRFFREINALATRIGKEPFKIMLE